MELIVCKSWKHASKMTYL